LVKVKVSVKIVDIDQIGMHALQLLHGIGLHCLDLTFRFFQSLPNGCI